MFELTARGMTFCDALAAGLRDSALPVAEGEFGADMQVSLVNDGPVTFLINL